MRLFILLAVLFIQNLEFCYAENLINMYELAYKNNADIIAARSNFYAQRQNIPIAQASLFPQVGANINSAQNRSVVTPNTNSTFYKTEVFGLNLTQPIFNLNKFIALKKANLDVKSAFASLTAAEQQLIYDTADQYFSVLKAIDDLEFNKTQRQAFAKSLEQANQQFKAGLIAITDVEISKARHDSANASEIAAQTAVLNEYESLRELIGGPVEKINPLQKKINLLPPSPNDINAWVKTSIAQNWKLKAALLASEALKTNIKIINSSNFPAVDLIGSISKGSSASTKIYGRPTNQMIGISLNLPLFSGGSSRAQGRQALHFYKQAQFKTEQLSRNTESLSRQAFRGVITQIAQIKALQQAVISNQSALNASQSAFDAGTRTLVDVLDAQSDFIKAKRDYAFARYDYILNSLKLKLAAGTLGVEDLKLINNWLHE
ncbi:MAG: uncharacterized protein JWM09_1055 [Francisellaceae bacterium]|nr:uncharacterized protein [Francisellaceae bacterium]